MRLDNQKIAIILLIALLILLLLIYFKIPSDPCKACETFFNKNCIDIPRFPNFPK